jgi:hypothetical protein
LQSIATEILKLRHASDPEIPIYKVCQPLANLCTGRRRSPNVVDYRRPGHTSDQYIRRTLNPAWPPLRTPVIVSKFKIRGTQHGGLKYWSIFDLLGLFLSALGEAPNGATKRTFSCLSRLCMGGGVRKSVARVHLCTSAHGLRGRAQPTDSFSVRQWVGIKQIRLLQALGNTFQPFKRRAI